MNNKSSLVIRMALIAVAFLLAACGGGGGGGSSGTVSTGLGGSNYGSLTLSGTGTTVTGTSFNALSKLAIGSSGVGMTTQWYNNDPPGGSYPYLVLNIFQDTTNAVTMVEVVNMTGPNNTFSGQWVAQPPTASAITTTASTITFNNLVVPGYAPASTTSSLTLSGTLHF